MDVHPHGLGVHPPRRVSSWACISNSGVHLINMDLTEYASQERVSYGYTSLADLSRGVYIIGVHFTEYASHRRVS